MWWQGSTAHCALHRVRGHKNSLPSPLLAPGLTWSHVPSQHLGLTTTPPLYRSGASLLWSLCQPVLLFVGIQNIGQTRSMLRKPWQKWLNLEDPGRELSLLETPLPLYITRQFIINSSRTICAYVLVNKHSRLFWQPGEICILHLV